MKHLFATLFLYCLLLSLGFSPLIAQADMSHSHLVLPGKKDALRPFYDKLNEMRLHPQSAPEVNVLHIGGSHVQAGDFSNTVRMRFMPTGDRGLLFPFRAIKTNGPTSYNCEYTGLWKGVRNVFPNPEVELGLAGAAAVTNDQRASVTLQLRDKGIWDFEQLIVLGQASNPDVVPYITTDTGDTLWCDPVLSRIVDVEGTWFFLLDHPVAKITLHIQGLTGVIPDGLSPKVYWPQRDKNHFVLRGLIPMGGHRGVTYTEAGINGASLTSWLRSSRHFEQELSLLPPDLVIFGIGVNDAHVPEAQFSPEVFKQRYRELVNRIRSVNPDCCLLWITNNDSAIRQGQNNYTPNKNGGRVKQAMMELAKEYNGAVLDVYSLMGGLGSSVKWVQEGLMKRDRIHFTLEGYQLIGNILYDAIAEDYAKYYSDTQENAAYSNANKGLRP